MLRLSKSKFLAGLQCPKRLWWTVREPEAPELAAAGDAPALERGRKVGELARARFAGGTLIDLPHDQPRERVEATARALREKAPAIFEASFFADDVFVAVDVLERRRRGFTLVEVKSSLDVKPEHVSDVALQVHVLGKAGLDIRRAEVMHLDRTCRYPRLSKLFSRQDVTKSVRRSLPDIAREIRSQRMVLAGPLPDHPVGPHCDDPYPCPFKARCHAPVPRHHISTLYSIRSGKVEALLRSGHETLRDLPAGFPSSPIARRQIRSARAGRMIVEPTLRSALEVLRPPIAFIDFETVNPAVPVWHGCSPYQHVPVQWSCHWVDGRRTRHDAWLADGSADPREPFARSLLAACKGARTLVAYHAQFEKTCLDTLAAALPRLAPGLRALQRRLVDLRPIVRDHVYHPGFGGSFSLKAVAPALVPGGGYRDLSIQGGDEAEAALEALLLDPQAMTARERAARRRDLLAYCQRDTWVMVRIVERLRGLAARGPRA